MTAGEEYIGRDLEVLSMLPNYYEWILSYFRPHIRGHGVEFGAGIGTVSALIRPQFDRLDLVEPSPRLVVDLKKRFAEDRAVTILHGALEDQAPDFADGSRDVAILVNVLEHIADDLRALRELLRILKPAGHLLIFVPALMFLFSDFDRVFGHHRRYQLKSLRNLLLGAGFQIEDVRYFDFPGIVPWWLINTLGRNTDINPALARIYDSVVVPVVRTMEALVPPPIGRNIVVVAKRP